MPMMSIAPVRESRLSLSEPAEVEGSEAFDGLSERGCFGAVLLAETLGVSHADREEMRGGSRIILMGATGGDIPCGLQLPKNNFHHGVLLAWRPVSRSHRRLCGNGTTRQIDCKHTPLTG